MALDLNTSKILHGSKNKLLAVFFSYFDRNRMSDSCQADTNTYERTEKTPAHTWPVSIIGLVFVCVSETGVKTVFKPCWQLQKLRGEDLLTGCQEPSFLNFFSFPTFNTSRLSTQAAEGEGLWGRHWGDTKNWERKIGTGIRVMKFEMAAYRGFWNIAVCLTQVLWVRAGGLFLRWDAERNRLFKSNSFSPLI